MYLLVSRHVLFLLDTKTNAIDDSIAKRNTKRVLQVGVLAESTCGQH